MTVSDSQYEIMLQSFLSSAPVLDCAVESKVQLDNQWSCLLFSSKDSTEEETEDRIFQENIIFGQLG